LTGNQAVLSLKDDKPVLEFLGVARSNHVKYLNGLLAKATEEVGGTLVQNPFFAIMGQQVTVHPIGYVFIPTRFTRVSHPAPVHAQPC
jgi:hypothetical protein